MTERRSALQVVEGIDLSGKVCVITGASSGLGRESARALAAAGAHVILAARNRDALAEAAAWTAAEVPEMSRISHLDMSARGLQPATVQPTTTYGTPPVKLCWARW